MIPDLAWWGQLFGLLATEAALLVALAAAGARWARSAHWRRLIWQSAFVAVALVWSVELAGGRGWLARWRPVPEPPRQVTARVIGDAPAVGEKVEFDFPPEVPVVAPAPASQPRWWPGVLWLGGMVALLLKTLGSRAWLAWRIRAGPGHEVGQAASLPTGAASGRLAACPTLIEALPAEGGDFDGLSDVTATVTRLRPALGVGPVRLVTWRQLRGPVAFGIIRPTVAVPAEFAERFPPAQREAMLAHELGHLAQRDPLWLLVTDLVCAFAWWHPAVWWARRQFRAACEAAADEASALVPGGRVALAEALVNFGRELTAPGGVGVGGSGLRSELARRVKALVERAGETRPVRSAGRWGLRGCLVMVLVALLSAPWPGDLHGLGPMIAAARAQQTVEKPPYESATDILADPQIREAEKELESNANASSVRNRSDAIPANPGATQKSARSSDPDVQRNEEVRHRDVLAALDAEKSRLRTSVYSTAPFIRHRGTGLEYGSSRPVGTFDDLGSDAVALAGGSRGWTNTGDRVTIELVVPAGGSMPPRGHPLVPQVPHPVSGEFQNTPYQGPYGETGLPPVAKAFGRVESSSVHFPPPGVSVVDQSAISGGFGYEQPHYPSAGSEGFRSEAGRNERERNVLNATNQPLRGVTVHTPAAGPTWSPSNVEMGVAMALKPGGMEEQRSAVRMMDSMFRDAAREAENATGAKQPALRLVAERWRDQRDFVAGYVAEAERRLRQQSAVELRAAKLELDVARVRHSEGSAELAAAEKRFSEAERSVFSLAQKSQLITRQFRVDPAKFSARVLTDFDPVAEAARRLEALPNRELNFSGGGGAATAPGDLPSAVIQTPLPGIAGVSRTSEPSLTAAILAYFRKHGVDFAPPAPPGTTAAEGQERSAIFYRPDPGVLFVRATLEDMAKIERALQGVEPVVRLSEVATTERARLQQAILKLEREYESISQRTDELRRRAASGSSASADSGPAVKSLEEQLRLVNAQTIEARRKLDQLAAAEAGQTQVELSVTLVEIADGGSDDVGLDWLFGQAATNNPPVVSALATNLPGSTGALQGDHLTVDRLAVEGQSAVLSGEQFAALRERLGKRNQVDFLSAPKVITLSGRQAQVSIAEVRTLVTGAVAENGSATNKAGIRYLTENVPVGPVVDLFPLAAGDAWQVRVVAAVTEFLGYDQPAKSDRVRATTAEGGVLKGTAPLPRLRVRETQSTVTAKAGEVIALRGPLAENVVRYKDKVPVLGDVPLLGRLFRKEGSQIQRKRLYVFVQPEMIDAQGNRPLSK